MPDLTKFSLSDMVVCSAALRRMADEATCMEEVAGRMVRFLYQNLRDTATGETSCSLIRFFKTHPFKDLDPDLQDYARSKLDGQFESPDMKCLTLLGTAGDDREWNFRKTSARYKSIPLAGEEFVAQFPMVSQLLSQLGLETKWLLNPSPDLLVDLEQRTYNVFYVPDALGSPYVPVQQDFVVRYGIKSVLGIGGLLPSGHLFAILLFSKVFIPRDVADLFRTLAVSAKAAILHFDAGPIFSPVDGDAAAVRGSATPAQPGQQRSQVTTLEQLLDVHERTVREQSSRLERALAETDVRAKQQAAVAELGQCALETADLSRLFDEAIALVCRTLDLPYGEIVELRSEAEAPLHRAIVGFKGDRSGTVLDTGENSLAGCTLRSKKAVIVENLQTETRFAAPPLWRDLGVVSGISVVIQGLGHPFGVLGAYATRGKVYTQEDIGFLEAIATLLSHALERQRAGQALETLRHQYQLLLDSAGEGIYGLDLEGRTTFVNPAAAAMLGYAVEDLIGVPMHAVLHHSRSDGTPYPLENCPIVAVVRDGVVCHVATEAFWRKNGTPFPVEYTSTPIRERGKIVGAVVTFSDITQRRQAEQTLRRHIMAMEASMDGMAVLDEQEHFIYLNEAHAAIYGYESAGDLIGESWRIFYDLDERRRFEQEVLPVLWAKGHWRGEAIGRRRDGSSFPQEVSLTKLIQGGLVCVVRDLTDRKKLEEELRQAQKMEAIGQLAGGVAHDFNNLLTAILGYGEILRSRLDQSPLQDAVGQITKAATRAAALTQQLLAFGRRQMLQPTVLNVNTVVADTAEMLQRLIGEHITLVTKPSAELGLVKADPVQLQQVILNLVINSRDAMPQGGLLTIETANVEFGEADSRRQAEVKAGPYVRLTVSDTGQGMDQATMSRIFEPFFTTKEVGKGTGLGLAMVYGTVKQSEGFIDVQSQPGQGATFSIYLPRLQDSAGTIDER